MTALALLHGTNSDGPSAFGHVIDRFTDQWKVLTPDYGGAGRSTVADGPLSLELLVAEIAEALRSGGEEPTDLVGHSLGAVVAAATAATHPELVHRLVLIAPWSDSRNPRHRLMFETWLGLQTLDPELGQRFGLSHAFSPTFLAALEQQQLDAMLSSNPPAGLDRRIDLGLRIDLTETLSAVTAPTLVIGLTKDSLVPLEHARSVHQAIPTSTFTEIDTGHAALLENPEATVTAIRTFLLPN
ncbi:alpha/beta fold hydrolase [Nocardia sp. NPDC052566]|uniref:alpha/beta fold hydrolase n=1 Tax=Nocardia sp. NPDC052566 TaxID=3364330 RepID=UPI0037C50795